MNYSTAVFLINDRVRAIHCTYEAGENQPRTLFKTFDATIKEGDFVVVPTNTRHLMTVVKVVAVDVEFDIETSAKVDWVISRLDLAPHWETLAQEQEAIRTIQSAEKNRKREELRKSVLADAAGALNNLPIAAIGHTQEPETQAG